MPSTENTESIVLALAAFVFRVCAHLAPGLGLEEFRAHQAERRELPEGRDHRLGVVQTASVDAQRKLILIRRDNIEHLIMTGGPVDVPIETGIEGHKPFEQPVGDVIIARSDTRPPPGVGKA